ncbi:MAG: hypothetical protein ABIP51_15980 [Bacteroidia bacterium]
MKPYTKVKNYDGKFEVRTSMYLAPGNDRKEMIANANRSLKKAYRQELKRELKKELEETLNNIN